MNRYDAFLQVLERGTFSDAARAMGYTQSAVSQMVKNLEEELGVTMLVRSRTGVSLTREGELLLPSIRGVANARLLLNEYAANLRGLESGTVRIGTFTTVSSSLLPPVIKRFKEAHPGIRFELHQGLYADVESLVRDGAVDFGFTDRVRCGDLQHEPLLRDSMLLVLPADHRLAGAESVSLSDLDDIPFIQLDEGPGGATLQRTVAMHPELDVQYRVADDYSVLNMVENGLGAALLPEIVLRNMNRNVAALPLNPPLKRSLVVIFRRREEMSTAATAFLQELRAEARKAK